MTQGLSNICVYKNRKTGNYSCRKTLTGTVDAHVDSVFMENCVFFVSKSQQKRAWDDEKRNVHAWIRGTFSLNFPENLPKNLDDWTKIDYKFPDYECFLAENGRKVACSSRCLVLPEGIWADGVWYR